MSARLPERVLPAHLRSAGAADRTGLARMLAGMDREGLYQRHFAHGERPNAALLERLATADGHRQAVMVAEAPDGRVIGHAEYVADADGVEFAMMVLPAWRGRGIARSLLGRLMARAGEAGYTEIHGLIQAGNTTMLSLVQQAGFDCRISDDPVVMLASRRLGLHDGEPWPTPPISC